jgi:hypothetical protein
MAIISRGVIIKNDPPDLIPKMDKKPAYAITRIMRIMDEEIIKIPNTFDFCINLKF